MNKKIEKSIIIPETYKYIAVFLTMRCNLSCSFCLNNLENSNSFNRNKFIELNGKEWIRGLNRIISRLDVPITFSGGEPLLHKDFFYIINNLKQELNIDLLTNLSYEKGIERLIKEINPQRLRRESSYASIRVSYHPEQMGNGKNLVKNVKKLKNAGFSVGIWAVLYPGSEQLSSINQMQFRCRDEDIDFRLKEFTGRHKGDLYGDYSKYPNSILQDETKSCLCKTSELLIGTNGNIYKCHRDLYSEENFIGNIINETFEMNAIFRDCNNYGQCHPCDVKVKTNYKQKLGHTSVEIKFI